MKSERKNKKQESDRQDIQERKLNYQIEKQQRKANT